MNFYLIEIDQTPGRNGLPNIEKKIAISNDFSKLEKYCEDTLKKTVGNPKNFSWDNYFIIRETEMLIL